VTGAGRGLGRDGAPTGGAPARAGAAGEIGGGASFGICTRSGGTPFPPLPGFSPPVPAFEITGGFGRSDGPVGICAKTAPSTIRATTKNNAPQT
jgi:hypothetical protein